MSEEKVCTACRFCKHSDYGYSNYTVTGTAYACLFGWMEFDEDMKEEDQQLANKKAEACEFYKEGTGIYIDCDGEQKFESVRDWITIHFKG